MSEAQKPLEQADKNPENIDESTGLLTKEAWKSYLAEQIKNNREDFGVIFIDLGNFKAVNDRYGHEYGDEVLQNTADILAETVRQTNQSRTTDYLAHERYINNETMRASRYGGDEFAVYCDLHPRDEDQEPLTNQQRISKVQARLRAAFDAMITDHGERLHDAQFSVSIGSAVYEPGMNSSDLLSQADKAMMLDKQEKQKERWESLSTEEKAALINPAVKAGLQKLGIRPPEIPDHEFEL